MSKKNDKKLTTASVLAFERKLDPSDALFYEGAWEQKASCEAWRPIEVKEKSIRGTISNRLKSKTSSDPAKLDAEVQKPNLQRVDVAALSHNADSIALSFTVRVLGGAGIPSACNDFEYQRALVGKIEAYTREHGFKVLGARYAYNLANARFLWRNRMVAESIETRVTHLVDGKAKSTWTFDSFSLPLRMFELSEEVSTLGEAIAGGLSGRGYQLFKVTSVARMGAGQEVYPSQELILDKGESGKGQKSKTLYAVKGVAGMHSQKIGNAIRTIDDWYPGEDKIGPISVEPYGAVTSLGRAFRQPKEKRDFYSLLDNWILKDEPPEIEQQHYVMANLVRGGVFGEKAD